MSISFYKYKEIFLLLVILTLGAFFRLCGLNWDQGYHLHPDERAIVMFTTPLHFPDNLSLFFSKDSPWNPNFFAYGSFPMYLLKIAGNIASIIDPTYATYDKINLLGRFLSSLFDIGTLLVLYLLAKKLFNKSVGFFAASFYAISVLPIQLSHFYAVDTLLTFFLLQILYQLLRLYEKPTVKKAILVGFFFGLSLATKISAIVILSSIGMAIAVDFLLIFLKNPHRPYIWFPHLPKFLKRLFVDITIIMTITLITFIIFEPYALIDFQTFWQQNMQQYQMTHDAFTFPYTLQYVGKIPYWYELKNIFLWGLGPILATLSFSGVLYITFRLARIHLRGGVAPAVHLGGETRGKQIIIIMTFFWVYLLVTGNFAIGFMRYMLPLYPLLCLFAAVFFFQLLNASRKLYAIRYTLYAFLILLLIWPTMFLHIYTQPNTRVLASNWINQNIPKDKTLAVEHWDDALPLYGSEKYNIETLPLYDPDTSAKWDTINKQLSKTDYIIIASNRLYVPLMKMTECKKLPIGRCYMQTANYYKRLFSGQNVILPFPSVIPSKVEGFRSSAVDARDSSVALLPQNDNTKNISFQKVAQFTIYPTFSFPHVKWKFEIDDSSADESFTVYDHPKIMIFKREK